MPQSQRHDHSFRQQLILIIRNNSDVYYIAFVSSDDHHYNRHNISIYSAINLRLHVYHIKIKCIGYFYILSVNHAEIILENKRIVNNFNSL